MNTVEDRFWAKVERRGLTECWPWTGCVQGSGHGQFRALGETVAHRVAYRLFFDAIPDGLLVLHHCDNPPCVNPRHLYAGTSVDNERDKYARGRGHARWQVCRRGHPLTGRNVVIEARALKYAEPVQRRCRICRNARQLARKRALRADSRSAPNAASAVAFDAEPAFGLLFPGEGPDAG